MKQNITFLPSGRYRGVKYGLLKVPETSAGIRGVVIAIRITQSAYAFAVHAKFQRRGVERIFRLTLR